MVGVWTPFSSSARVRPAQGSHGRQRGPTQSHLSAVLGLHLAAGDATALVLRVQPEVKMTSHGMSWVVEHV